MILKKIDSAYYKLFYLPLCRAYARYIIGDKPADPLLSGLIFWKVHRYWPHFKNPRSFSEKVVNPMLFDRNTLWTILSYKLRVREYIASKVGKEYLIPLLWNGNNPEEILFNELPLKFVIKATHGCKYNIIVTDKMQLDRTQAKIQLLRGA